MLIDNGIIMTGNLLLGKKAGNCRSQIPSEKEQSMNASEGFGLGEEQGQFKLKVIFLIN